MSSWISSTRNSGRYDDKLSLHSIRTDRAKPPLASMRFSNTPLFQTLTHDLHSGGRLISGANSVHDGVVRLECLTRAGCSQSARGLAGRVHADQWQEYRYYACAIVLALLQNDKPTQWVFLTAPL